MDPEEKVQRILGRYRELDSTGSPSEVRVIAKMFLALARASFPPSMDAHIQVFRTWTKCYRELDQPLLTMLCDTAAEDLERLYQYRTEAFKKSSTKELSTRNQ